MTRLNAPSLSDQGKQAYPKQVRALCCGVKLCARRKDHTNAVSEMEVRSLPETLCVPPWPTFFETLTDSGRALKVVAAQD